MVIEWQGVCVDAGKDGDLFSRRGDRKLRTVDEVVEERCGCDAVERTASVRTVSRWWPKKKRKEEEEEKRTICLRASVRLTAL